MTKLLYQLCSSGEVFQGRGTDTCAAASMQASLGQSDPGEYVRLAADLLLKGSASLGGGHCIPLSTEGCGKEEGRHDFDDIMQGSLISFARKFASMGEDYFSGRTSGTAGTLRGDAGQGLSANQIRHMLEAVTGEPASIVLANPSNRQKMIDAMREATESGYNVVIGQDGHALDVIKISTDPKSGVEYIEYFDSLTGVARNSPLSSFGSLDMMILPALVAAGQDFVKSESQSDDDYGGRTVGSGTVR